MGRHNPAARTAPAAPAAARSARARGFTLLEVAIYLAVAGIVGGPMVALVITSTRAVADIDVTANLQERNRVVAYSVDREIRDAIDSTVLVTNSGRGLRFTLATGYDGWNPIPGASVEYLFSLSSGEAGGGLDGDDDDGDGLADDGILTRRNLTTGENVVICAGVDMNASGFAFAGSAVVVNLTHFGDVIRTSTPRSVATTLTTYPEN